MLNYGPDTFRFASVGDIVSIDGRKYRLLKKTKSAVSVRRHYWFDDLAQTLFRKLGMTS